MKRAFSPTHLDVRTFAETGTLLEDDEPLSAFARLSQEAAADPGAARVRWKAHGLMRQAGISASLVPWLHLEADSALPLICQRCLEPMTAALKVDRWFRFVADEATAAAEDEQAHEDVLALSRDFDLRGLVEDELLMEIPVTPRHVRCPRPLPSSVVDPDFDAAQKEKSQPFSVLENLRSSKNDD